MMTTAEQPQPEQAMQNSGRHVKYFNAAVSWPMGMYYNNTLQKWNRLRENSVRNEKAQPTILPVEVDCSKMMGADYSRPARKRR